MNKIEVGQMPKNSCKEARNNTSSPNPAAKDKKNTSNTLRRSFLKNSDRSYVDLDINSTSPNLSAIRAALNPNRIPAGIK